MDKKLQEYTAAAQHDIWSHWMAYLFSQCKITPEGLLIPEEKVHEWELQMTTPYNELPDMEIGSGDKIDTESRTGYPKKKELYIISDESEYEAALGHVWSLMDAEPNTEEIEQLIYWANLVAEYEDLHYPMKPVAEGKAPLPDWTLPICQADENYPEMNCFIMSPYGDDVYYFCVNEVDWYLELPDITQLPSVAVAIGIDPRTTKGIDWRSTLKFRK